MTATEQVLKVEERLRYAIRNRVKTQKIILAALERAISDGLKLEDSETIWIGSQKDYAAGLLGIWLKDEDGDLAIDRLVNLIIH